MWLLQERSYITNLHILLSLDIAWAVDFVFHLERLTLGLQILVMGLESPVILKIRFEINI